LQRPLQNPPLRLTEAVQVAGSVGTSGATDPHPVLPRVCAARARGHV